MKHRYSSVIDGKDLCTGHHWGDSHVVWKFPLDKSNMADIACKFRQWSFSLSFLIVFSLSLHPRGFYFFYVCVFNVILSNFFIHVWLYWGSWQVTIFFIGICFAWFHCFNSSPGYLFVLKSMPLFVGYLSSVFIFHLASVSDEKYGGLKK